jgi:hypothetical protein
MRQEYKCVCDKCKKEMTTANDENDVSFNGLKLVYCQSCYDDLMAIWELWSKDIKTLWELWSKKDERTN